ncbi:MAG: RHS repeat protein [Chloroflexi bacterium]|nr:RHS repeat protein [Chloroflexota bacterium]
MGVTPDFVNDYSYDALGRMTQVTQQDQGANAVAEKLVTFDYDPAGRFSQIARYADLLETESVAATDFAYDAAVSTEGRSGDRYGIAYGYRDGDLAFEPDRWGPGTNDGEFGVTGSFFERNLPLNTPTTTYAYDAFGNLVQVTDPKAHTTTYDYDALNRLVETTLENRGRHRLRLQQPGQPKPR